MGGTTSVSPAPGAVTRRDILTQTDAWREAIRVVASRAGELAGDWRADWRLLFVGCGSSYNTGVLAAAGWNALAGRSARAVTAGEYLRLRETVTARPEQDVVCLLSRSGTTSETLAALRAAKDSGCPTLAVCCTSDAPLAREADRVLALPAALEEAIIATRSVTAMGLAALLMAAETGNRADVAAELRKLPETVAALAQLAFDRGEALLPAAAERVVFLGSGALGATALAAQLVCQELALMDAWAYPTLDFRHGPIVLAKPGTQIVLFATRSGEELEAALFDDLAGRGCRRLWVGPPRVVGRPDELLTLPTELSDWSRALLALLPFQAAAWGRTVREGRDPDDGSGLPRVVHLNL